MKSLQDSIDYSYVPMTDAEANWNFQLHYFYVDGMNDAINGVDPRSEMVFHSALRQAYDEGYAEGLQFNIKYA